MVVHVRPTVQLPANHFK